MRMTMVGVAALCASLAGAEEPWLPAPVAEQMAGQMYERVKAAAPDGPEPGTGWGGCWSADPRGPTGAR